MATYRTTLQASIRECTQRYDRPKEQRLATLLTSTGLESQGCKVSRGAPYAGLQTSHNPRSLASIEREAKQALTDSGFRETIATVTASGTTRVGVVLAATPQAAILLRQFA